LSAHELPFHIGGLDHSVQAAGQRSGLASELDAQRVGVDVHFELVGLHTRRQLELDRHRVVVLLKDRRLEVRDWPHSRQLPRLLCLVDRIGERLPVAQLLDAELAQVLKQQRPVG